MSTQEPADTTRRYSDICGASNRNGEPCSLPAGWGTPGSQGGRCKFHGGSSTGPKDVEHLEGNDFATDNPGGGPSEGNTNAEIHGGFADWRKVYDRLEGAEREHVDRLLESLRERAAEHAPDVPEDRREELVRERATLSVMHDRAAVDTLGTPKDPVDGARGFIIEEEREHAGEHYTVRKANPALGAIQAIHARERAIAKELRLWPGFREE